jgi:CRP-like cAMP-binding protein
MDLLGRFSGLLDSFRRPPDDPTQTGPAEPDSPVRLTLWGRRFKLQLEIPWAGKADDAELTSAEAEQIPVSHDEPTAPPEPHRHNHADCFWDALDPIEREALRSVASWRTFAAGARLMEEGERADHVMVILGGRVKVCVDENGSERVLAVRGLGQLVGERGALKVSVRSATVIAQDMIWALVVQTKDFAAFVSAHPRVLDIVQNQLYQRRTEEPARYRHATNGPDGFRATPAESTAAADQFDDNYRPDHSRRHSQPLNGENCTVFLTDVVGFGARIRTDGDRLLIRDALFQMTQAAMQGVPDAQSEDRGDGFLTVVPPNISTATVLDELLKALPAALERHNSAQRESARFKLRLAVNVGPVVSDIMGVSGEAIIVVARLVEAPSFKKAIAESPVSLGVIASPFVYEAVIRHSSNPSDLASYSRVPVEVKESDTTAWMRLLDPPLPSCLVPHPAVPESRLGQLT